MARKLTGREYFFIGVLAVSAVAYLLYRDDGSLFGGAQDEKKEGPKVGIAPIVRMANLTSDPEDYDPKGRNLFEYYTPPPPRRQVQQKQPVVRKPVDRPPPRPPQQPAVRKQAEPVLRPPSIDFKYLGFLGPNESKIAVFEDGEEMLLAHTGEVVQKQFRVVEFKYESVVMGYVDTRFKDMTTELNMRRN